MPVGCGRILSHEVAKQGKAVQMEHWLCDELWNRGNKKIPAAPKVSKIEEKEEIKVEEVQEKPSEEKVVEEEE